jgi:Tol biopolymer transport system component/DNA-binding winged helix-turn-helix (wHTH) protein
VESTRHGHGAYEFGPFRIDLGERLLRRGSDVLPLTPKAVETLVALVEESGRLVSKDELMRRLWPGTFVEEANLTNQISLLRKALGDDAAEPSYIETVPRRGYRFIAEVKGAVRPQDARTVESIVPNGGAPARRRPGVTLLLAAAGCILLAAIAASWWQIRGERSTAGVPLKITRLTTSGQVRHAVASPDGKYVAFVSLEQGGQSLWIRQMPSASLVQVVPTAAVNYLGLTFSPDATSIYYVVREQGQPREGALYKVAVLGGSAPPQQLLAEIDTPIAFSPDGGRIAYIVSNQLTGESALMIADADGRGAYIRAERKTPDAFTWIAAAPLWTPNGTRIITSATGKDARGSYSSLVQVDTVSGAQMPLGSRRFTEVGRLAWLNDDELVMAASDLLGANQLWRVSYPAGEAQQITNDESKNYLGVSVTAAGAIVTVQRDPQASIRVAEQGDSRRIRQVTAGKYDGRHGLAWTRDGRILYHSLESGNEDLWIMNADGSGRRQLTVDGGVDDRPSLSADGRYVVFGSNRTGSFTIWRRELAGGGERPLGRGYDDEGPVVTPDNRWVVFSSAASGTPTLWKVPLEGGEPVQLTTLTSMDPVVSPDGALVAFRLRDDPDTDGKLAVLRLSDGRLVKTFEPPPQGPEPHPGQWTADGITFTRASHDGSNIWTQPLDGRPSRQLTHFASERILHYQWSADGKSLVYAHGTMNNDVVLISNVPRMR